MVPPSPIMAAPPMMGVGSGASSNDVNSLINSIHAFQLGQGMANSAGLNPAMMAPGHMGGMQPSFGQAYSPNPAQNMSPTPTLGSFATPHASLMSPTSDPYNPFNPVSDYLSVSHDCTNLFPIVQFNNPADPSRGQNPAMRFNSPNRNEAPAFELSPTFGGLGMQSAQMGDMNTGMPRQFMMPHQPPSGGMVSSRGDARHIHGINPLMLPLVNSSRKPKKQVTPCHPKWTRKGVEMCIINEKEKKQAPQAIIIDLDNQCAPVIRTTKVARKREDRTRIEEDNEDTLDDIKTSYGGTA